ncbi:hypothetical protein F5B18DRAFT_647873 [Nemania serpens]|nr:hypothetical protein F5B18DRAFT_647873 [Nemania serpens]
MTSRDQELTHDEIWDDSALIDSWDQALEEYKKYHSIHRNGGNVKDLLKSGSEGASDAKPSLHQMDESSNHGGDETASGMRQENPNNGQSAINAAVQHSQPPVSSAPPAPAGLLGTIRDEGLKRLLMSWYYAGYYTGYYEGQRDTPQNGRDSE